MKQPKTIEWTRLDNASKIFPAVWNVKDPKVFRITCELYDAVDADFLQTALDYTIEDYPLYKSVLRRGMFWYYLERSDIRPEVAVESNTVCAPIYVGHRNDLLFRVFYYKNRINLEVFHTLSDGTGALRFLQDLVYHYIMVKDKEKFAEMIPLNDNSSASGQMDDSFGKHFVGGNNKKIEKETRGNTRAYQIHGTIFDDNRINLIEGAMSTKAVLDEAHKFNTTLTVFLTASYLYAISKGMTALRKRQPIVITVPVNLRQYFESDTARNFFSYINISFRFEKDNDDFQSVIRSISESFKRDMTLEQLRNQSNKFMALEQNLFARIVPLPIKDLVIRLIVNKSLTQTTSMISNIGKISMPVEFRSIIRQFSVCTSASRPQMTLCSFGDRLVVSIASPYRDSAIQRTFFQMLSKLGIKIELSSNI